MMLRKPTALFFIICLLVCNAYKCFSQADVNILKTNSDEHTVRVSYYASHKPLPDVSYALKAEKQSRFISVTATVFNGGIADNYYWFHFYLKNETNTTGRFYIEIENPRLNNLSLYEALADGSTNSLGQLGDFYPFAQRTIHDKDFVYAVDMAPKEGKEYYLYVNQVGHTFTLPIFISDAATFRALSYQDYLTDGVVYGILLFVSVLSFIFFVNTWRASRSADDIDNRLYFCYSAYILTGIFWLFSYFGLGYQYVWGGHPVANTAAAPFFAGINLIFNIEIARCFLRQKIQNTYINRASQVCQWLLAAAALFPLVINLNEASYELNRAYLTLFLLVVLGSITVTMYTVAISVRGSSAAGYYMVSSIVKFIGIFNLALLEFGFTRALPYLERLLQAGILVETFLLSYAIAYRYAILKIGNYKRVLEAQDRERLSIARDLHDGVSSPLTGILFAAYNIQRAPATAKDGVQVLIEELQKLQKESRNIAHQLVPSYINEQPLEAMVQQYVDNLNQHITQQPEGVLKSISFSYNHTKRSIDGNIKIHIYRIMQELLTNIMKHSAATQAAIQFAFGKRKLVISVEDNGKGITVENQANGMGIKNILSRTDIIGGQIGFKPGADKKGTLVTLTIPLRRKWFVARWL